MTTIESITPSAKRNYILNRQAGIFSAALISIGVFDFCIHLGEYDEGVVTISLPVYCSKYDYVKIYADGLCHYYINKSVEFEGTLRRVVIKNLTTVKNDILGI